MAAGKNQAAVDQGPVEGPWDLPDGWRWERLGMLADFINGAAFKPVDWHGEGRPIIRIQNLNDPTKTPNLTRRELPEKYVVEAGDILLSWSASLDVYEWRGPTAWLNQHIFKIDKIKPEIDKRYFRFLLKNEIEILKRSDHLHGSTMMHINRGPFMAHPVPVPPLETQKNISAKIDSLFNEIESGEADLTEARAGIETYRKSLLKAAVTGQLTNDWRCDNPPAESGKQLLQRILADRRARWEADLKNSRKNYVEPAEPDSDGLPKLPEGWVWGTIEQLSAASSSSISDGPFGSNLKSEHYRDIGPRVIRLQNIGKDGTFVDAAAHIDPGHFATLTRHHLESGDLVIAILGEPLPRAVIIPEGVAPALVKADCIKVRLAGQVPPQFVWAWLNCSIAHSYFANDIKGVGRPRIAMQKLKTMPVPIAPRSEAARIVDMIEDGLKLAEYAKTANTEWTTQSSKLRKSILAAAFSGELIA